MIKVNLLKGAAQKNPTQGSADQSGDSYAMQGQAQQNNGALVQRFVAVIIPVALTFGYGWYNESQLKNNIEAANLEIKNVEEQSKSFAPQLEAITKLNTEKNRLTAQINIIKELSKSRYSYVKVLDAMQTLIPEKAWITKMTVRDKQISIDGRAVDEVIISTFMQNLEESAYFSNVSWVDSRDVAEPQGVVKAFSIKFNLEQI